MVMVPGERKLKLRLTVVRNYSLPQLQPAKGRAQGSKHVITLSEMGAGQTSRSHID